MTKVYIKHFGYDSNTYSYEGEKLEYRVTFMEGPFESIAEAVEQIRSACYDGAEIVEFEE